MAKKQAKNEEVSEEGGQAGAEDRRRRPSRSRRPRPKSTKYVYFFGGAKSDGDRTMRDLLGGKGANLAEMANAGLPVPARIHHHDDRLHAVVRQRPQADAGDRSRDGEPTSASSRRPPGLTFGSTSNPLLVSVRSGAKFSMPGMMDTILNLGLNDAGRRGAEEEDRQRPLRLRQLPPLHPDVRQRRARDRQGQVRARVRGGQARARRGHRHRPGRGRPEGDRRALQGAHQEQDRQAVPAGPVRPAARRARRGVPLVEQRPREDLPPPVRDPGPHRHGRQRAADGVRQHAATGRPPASASRATRRPAPTSSSASSSSTPRAKTSSPASARRCRSPSSRR